MYVQNMQMIQKYKIMAYTEYVTCLNLLLSKEKFSLKRIYAIAYDPQWVSVEEFSRTRGRIEIS